MHPPGSGQDPAGRPAPRPSTRSPREDRPTVRDGDRIDVDVHNLRRRVSEPRDLVGITHRRNPRSNVEELGDALPDSESHRPTQERPIGLHHQRQLRPHLDGFPAPSPDRPENYGSHPGSSHIPGRRSVDPDQPQRAPNSVATKDLPLSTPYPSMVARSSVPLLMRSAAPIRLPNGARRWRAARRRRTWHTLLGRAVACASITTP